MPPVLDQPPPLMTRRELAEYCNQRWPDRRDPITPRMVKYWEEEGLITPHRSFSGKRGRTVRYATDEVVRFVNDIE